MIEPRPLWTDSTIQIVEEILTSRMNVYELGSGYSTLWLGKRVNKLLSVESDLMWLTKIRDEVEKGGYENVFVHFRDITKPEYIQHILDCAEESFDFVVVDSAFRRVEVFEKVLSKVVKGGYILLDDSQNLSWLGCFHVSGAEVFKKSEPDKNGKQATIFRRI